MVSWGRLELSIDGGLHEKSGREPRWNLPGDFYVWAVNREVLGVCVYEGPCGPVRVWAQ